MVQSERAARAVTSGVADILVRNARLRGRGDALSDIAISDGVILEVGARVDIDARSIVDARGNLVTPSYVNPHLHLCKVWTLPMMSEAALEAYHGAGMSDALKAIDLAAATSTPGSSSTSGCVTATRAASRSMPQATPSAWR